MCVYLHTKSQVSSIILTSFIQGINFNPLPPLTSIRTPKKPTQIRVKIFIENLHEKSGCNIYRKLKNFLKAYKKWVKPRNTLL